MSRDQFEEADAYVYKQLRKTQTDLIHAYSRGDERATEDIQKKFNIWNTIDKIMHVYKRLYFS